ncbi:TPA: hypothetical protein U0G25_002770 [Listeria monocytogenes]|nr:hypothetical protein [Listeria monocytogenes]HEL8941511.1 hypothetical protein [Listeria monocytogenes]
MTQTIIKNTTDEAYKKLRNKLKNDEEISRRDLLESLKLYEITNKELKKAKNKYRKWTEDEDAYLIAFVEANDAPIQDAVDFLGRPQGSVENRMHVLRKRGEMVYKMPPWSEKEDEFIRKHYKSLSPRIIAQRLNRSYNAVTSRVWALGLKEEAE